MSLTAPDPMEEYLFDLRGYTMLEQAIDGDHLHAMNAWLDALPPIEPDQWYGNIDVHTYGAVDGINLQNIIEGGEIFERLIDHPSWIERVRHYIGKTYRPFINESFINLRGPGGYIGVHSGGDSSFIFSGSGRKRGEWCCGYLTLMVALNAVGEGDGATILVPGSHKSDIQHPSQSEHGTRWLKDAVPMKVDEGTQAKGHAAEGGIEIHLKAGDGILFNDSLCHGSGERTNPGERRMIVFRYLPSPIARRFLYEPSQELLTRLTPERRALVQPVTPRRRPSEVES